ncbi:MULTISPECIES: XrtA/PEP-CTERM system histidine kinase PrsK [unclassified Sphingobium]|uniref:XrtA/PEP-CTERM system histidine kinase PrsK n=1 Tax=unclassified Sphingobium TaxID=2611147 RepID=UPI002224B907|nr:MULTISPECIES: XrtA/PEP-CTERM system histidine kinase PrsK [unclassified Sphingobium]MCW2394670.1 putative PEP-CTERM system histidine kinase [Sphingobium sp. B8D3B]MCW2418184.1 putative PEP-CTERM system histidine kinase [Sphingobium sp. B8D3C]
MTVWLIAGHLGHALAAILFATLAILISRQPHRIAAAQFVIVALALTALWSLRHAFVGFSPLGQLSDGVTETMRNAAWLAALASLSRVWRPGGRAGPKVVVLALALVLAVQLIFDLQMGEGIRFDRRILVYFEMTWMLRAAFALGALLLLFRWNTGRGDPESARREGWLAAALACMWAYDFNHYLLVWFAEGSMTPLAPMRGFVMAVLAIMLALGLRSDGTRAFALSRTLTTRLVSAGLALFYICVILLLVGLLSGMSAPMARIVQFALLFTLAVAVLAFLPSASMRSWLRGEISKHVFAHRYDYRSLWLRFSATMDGGDTDDTSLDCRIARAIAQAVDAPAGALYLRQDERLVRVCAYAWPEASPAPLTLPIAVADRMVPAGKILDIAREGHDLGALLPASMLESRVAWAIAPLICRDEIIGVMLLAAPPRSRALDWEDFDVLRVVCGEAAARVAEERHREALAEAQRFEEFNRRFAFILHDLKNLVSQMTLLAGNARRHADNPAFREDMILTLEETSSRMNDLIQRLGRGGRARPSEREELLLGPWLGDLARAWAGGTRNVVVEGALDQRVIVDADNLQRALTHLVRNAIEASPHGALVRIVVEQGDAGLDLHVIDRGKGMSAAFMRDRLFRPFSSTKANGFGLGAHETRALVEAMGGRLLVQSVEGEGSQFTIWLPVSSPSENARDMPMRSMT